MLIKSKDVIYSDIDLSFNKHPITGDLLKRTNERAVQQSVEILVLLAYNDLYQTNKGSNVLEYMFDNLDSITSFYIQKEIERVITSYEPRINKNDLKVSVVLEEDYNRFTVNIEYYIIDISTPQSISMFLQKVR